MAKLSSGPVTEYRVHDCSMFVIDDPMTTVIVSPSEAQDTTFLHKRADVDSESHQFGACAINGRNHFKFGTASLCN